LKTKAHANTHGKHDGTQTHVNNSTGQWEGLARRSENISKATMTVTTVIMMAMANVLMRMKKIMLMPMMMKTMLIMKWF
jgi:hypothetical protein